MSVSSSIRNSGICLTSSAGYGMLGSAVHSYLFSFPLLIMDDNSPATKADITKLDGRITDLASAFDSKLMNFAEEIKRHFDVIAEDLRHDVMGANRDEVSSIMDKQQDHSGRIEHLEKLAGMPV